MSRASQLAGRAYSRAASDFGGANVDRLLLYGGILVVAIVGYKAYKAAKAIGSGVSAATKGAAEAYVNATHPGVQLADGIMYILPNGSAIAANLTTPIGGGKFVYLGKTYKPYEASPPGSGYYKVKPA